MIKLVSRLTVMLAVLCSTTLVWTGPEPLAQESFVLYDRFDGLALDPDRWYGNSQEGCCVTDIEGLSAPSLEFVRRIQDGTLRLALVSYGSPTPPPGGFTSRQGLALRVNSQPFIKGLQAKVRVLTADVEACGASPANSVQSRFYVMGFFFNDGTATGPADTTGNIIGWFQLQKDADGSQRLTGLVLRCTEATNCSTADEIGNVEFTSTWAVETTMVLRLVWQAGKNRFKFQLNPGQPTEEIRFVDYVVTDTEPPSGFDFKSIRVQNFAGNCDGERTSAAIEVAVGNVYVSRP